MQALQRRFFNILYVNFNEINVNSVRMLQLHVSTNLSFLRVTIQAFNFPEELIFGYIDHLKFCY